MKHTEQKQQSQPEQAQEQAQTATGTAAQTIKELQETACKVLNELTAALRTERYKVNDVISLFGFAIEATKDKNFDLHFQPRDLTHADCIRYGSREDTEAPDETDETPQRPQQRTEPLNINSNPKTARRILGGKISGN